MLAARRPLHSVHEIGIQRGDVLIAQQRIRGIRHRWIERDAFIVNTVAHGAIEVIERELTDSGFGMRRYIRAVDRTDGRINGETPANGLPPGAVWQAVQSAATAR